MNSFFSKIYHLLDKIQSFLVKCFIKPKVKHSFGEHIDNQKNRKKDGKMTTDENKETKIKIIKRSEDFSRWYLDVIAAADLADYAPV